MKNVLRCFTALAALMACQAVARADDMIVDGKHCNSFCQHWLGIAPQPAQVATAPRSPVAPNPAADVDATRRRPEPLTRPDQPKRPVAPVPQLAQNEAGDVPERIEPDDEPAMRVRRPTASPRPRAASAVPDNGLPRPIFATLPKSSELVAVRGEIIVESAEARALQRRQLADMLSATTRPKPTAAAPSAAALPLDATAVAPGAVQ